jgi:hypothetical protein
LKNYLVKKLLIIFFISLCFTTSSKSQDISDFQIEAITIGDSLLNFFNKNTIESSRMYTYKDKTFYSLDIWSDKFKEFDAMQFHLKKNDKKFKIYGFSGAITFGKLGEHYPKSEKECKIKKKIIENDIESLFPNADKSRHSGVGEYPDDPKVIRHDTYIVLNSGDVWLQCYTFSKKPKKELNLIDNLKVTILSIEFKKWLNTKAY